MKIAPSVLTANFMKLEQELDSIKTADYLHLDIMDGHFVPNISFGPAISKQIAKYSFLPLDIHLMVSDPCVWISDFAFSNAKYITFHLETKQVEKTIQAIKNKNIKVGISLKPDTPTSALLPYLKDIDLALVMTVEPGFGGQSFIESSLEKVKELVLLRAKYNLSFVIEVDGGVNKETLKKCGKAGVDIAVVGSYLFNQSNRKKTIEELR